MRSKFESMSTEELIKLLNQLDDELDEAMHSTNDNACDISMQIYYTVKLIIEELICRKVDGWWSL